MRVRVRLEGIVVSLRPEDVDAYMAAHPEAEVVGRHGKAVKGPPNDKALAPSENKGA